MRKAGGREAGTLGEAAIRRGGWASSKTLIGHPALRVCELAPKAGIISRNSMVFRGVRRFRPDASLGF
jgi:hypothetical protein